MATYSIWIYQTDDLTGVPNESGLLSGGEAVGSPPFTIGVNSGADWIEIIVEDDETTFGEDDTTQALAQDVTINGVTYTAGTDIYSAYVLTDSTTGHEITSIQIGGSGSGGFWVTGPVIGIMSSDPMSPGSSYTFDGEDSSVGNPVPYEGDDSYICFGRGALIQTPSGEIPVEDLQAGDQVVTQNSGTQTIRWIGSREITTSSKTAPIIITKGALGDLNGEPLPKQDLIVSPQHRMLVTDWRAELLFGESTVLIAAKHLVNGDTIYVSPTPTVEYFHILFDKHEIIFANSSPSESFHPGKQGFGVMPEDSRTEIYEIFPELQNNFESYGALAVPALKAYEVRAMLGTETGCTSRI